MIRLEGRLSDGRTGRSPRGVEIAAREIRAISAPPEMSVRLAGQPRPRREDRKVRHHRRWRVAASCWFY